MSILKDAAERYLSVLHTGTNFEISEFENGIKIKGKSPEITMNITEREVGDMLCYEIKPISPIFNTDMDLDLESNPLKAVQNALEKYYFKAINDRAFDIDESSKTPEEFIAKFSEYTEKSLVVEIVKKKSNQYGVGVGNPDAITIDETYVDDKFTYNLSKNGKVYHGIAHSEKMPAFNGALEIATNDAMKDYMTKLSNKHQYEFKNVQKVSSLKQKR